MRPTELTAVVETYLHRLADPEAGLALHELLAAAAVVPFRLEALPVGEIPAEAYAETHRAIAHAYMEAGRTPPAWRELVPVSESDAGPGRRMGWWTVRESGSDTTWALGVGVVERPGGWAIAWATLAESPQPWSFELGLAQTLSDFPFRTPIAARGWLDLAHARLVGHDRPTFQVLPEARFSCAGSAACCRVDYVVEVDPVFQRVIDAVPWETVRPGLTDTQLPVLPNGQLEVKQHGMDCRFLDENRRCVVHAALGRAVFPPCSRFPFSFAETPDGVAVSASFVCGTVRANLGAPLSTRSNDLYQRLAIAPQSVVRPASWRIFAGEPVAWEEYKTAETALVTLLGRAELPLWRRLWLGSVLLTSWRAGARELTPEAEATPVGFAPPQEREAIQALLADFLLCLRIRHVPDIHRDDPLACSETLAVMIRHVLFAKILPTAFDLVTAYNLGLVMMLMAWHMEKAWQGQLGDADWEGLSQMFMHGGVLGVLQGDDEGARSRRAMFASPEFGLWLMTYPLAGAEAQA